MGIVMKGATSTGAYKNLSVGSDGGLSMGGVSACKLTKGGTVAEKVTCTVAGTDYPAATAMPAGTKYVIVSCDVACEVAMGAAVTDTNCLPIPPSSSLPWPVTVTGTTADDKPHVRCATAGKIVTFTYMAD